MYQFSYVNVYTLVTFILNVTIDRTELTFTRRKVILRGLVRYLGNKVVLPCYDPPLKIR